MRKLWFAAFVAYGVLGCTLVGIWSIVVLVQDGRPEPISISVTGACVTAWGYRTRILARQRLYSREMKIYSLLSWSLPIAAAVACLLKL